MQTDRYVPPSGHPLHPYLLGIFRLRADRVFRRETILPKGNVDVLFNLGDPFRLEGKRLTMDRVTWAGAAVAGLQTRAVVSHPQGGVDLLGVSLRAETCAALLPLPMGDLTDRFVAGALVFTELREMEERLRAAPSFTAQCELLVSWLLALLRPAPAADAVRHACALLRREPGESAVGRVAKSMAVSPRHLRRLFGEHVGVSPAQYVRVARFADAMHRVAAPGATLTAIAHSAGYYDQAHFCREFRHFAGMTPQEYRALAAGPTVGHIFSA